MTPLKPATLDELRDGEGAEYLPRRHSVAALTDAVQGCRGCPLWRDATQAVFGEGPAKARLMLVGEQPGDREDLEGRPFVGPAGGFLDGALVDAGIDRSLVYVTNVVKHFKWTARGTRRIHQRPKDDEIDACGPWLASEIEVVRPNAIALLGATAAQALLGRSFRVTRERGEVFTELSLAPYVVATVHPASILRMRGSAERAAAREQFVADLATIAPHVR